MTDWVEVEFLIQEQVEPLLMEQLGVQFPDKTVAVEQLGDPASLDPRKMLPDIKVKLFIESDEVSPQLQTRLMRIAEGLAIEPPSINQLQPVDWQQAWRANYHQFEVGERFLVLPEWEEPALDIEDLGRESRLPIKLNPGMAFGTGLHETTQLCLEALERLVLKQMHILDLGAGSGILSIASILLGAAAVDAIEIDQDAYRNLDYNVALNGMSDAISIQQGGLDKGMQALYDLVYANILAVILIKLIETEGLLSRIKPLTGRILFSGIIDQQLPEFLDVLKRHGGHVLEIKRKGEWISVLARR